MVDLDVECPILESDSYSFEELNSGALVHIPIASGIYKVYKPNNFEIKFRVDTDSPYAVYTVNELCEKWTTICKYPGYEDGLLYIGRAINLQKRIRQFVRTGYGKNAKHSGGKAIFQLENNKQLRIKIFECEDYKEREAKEIEAYKKHRTVYPLANWQSGTKQSL